MKHTVTNVGLISIPFSDKYLQGHCTCDILYLMCIVMITIQSFRPRADGFGTTDVCDFVLLMKFVKLIVRKHF